MLQPDTQKLKNIETTFFEEKIIFKAREDAVKTSPGICVDVSYFDFETQQINKL